MGEIFKRMKQVSESGDPDAFYTLIREHSECGVVELLNHIDELPLFDTPLHIAASAGHIQFSLEMMGLKPSFSRKPNLDGFSPIHLALQNGHIELVRQLIQVDRDLVRVKGRERLTPLHYVVEGGEHLHYLLEEFLLVCPESIIDVTVRNETALHIALKNDKLEAFKFFVGWLASNSSKNTEFNQRTVLNWKDNEGNTVLHILVSKNHTEAVGHFLSWCEEFVDVNLKNLASETAWDISREDNCAIRIMLRCARAKPGSSDGYPNLKYQMTAPPWVNGLIFKKVRRELRKFTVEWRNVLLVVAALLVTLSFQAVLTPPGGVWQDNGQCITAEPGSRNHQYSPFNSFKKNPPSNKTVGSSNYPQIIYLSQSNTTLACEHKAGTAIALQDGASFYLFLFCNTMLFAISNSLILLLILNSFIKFLFLLLNIMLCVTYFYTVYTITQGSILMIVIMIIASLYFAFIQFLSWKQ